MPIYETLPPTPPPYQDAAPPVVVDLTREEVEQSQRKIVDNDDSVLILEVMSRGDLDKWIAKMGVINRHKAEPQDRFSDKVLWLMFECLFKGVAGTAYPLVGWHNYWSTGGDLGPTVDGRIPPFDYRGAEWTHFDLDPLNILVGDSNDGQNQHTLMPIIKIGDLGLGSNMKTIKKREPIKLWYLDVSASGAEDSSCTRVPPASSWPEAICIQYLTVPA
ncbi:hypothetical protein B0H67DRAFT_639418 [Lasiosphaeris hirsuta]|uniref:Protein kinase domain-containing protein n=1 Tax=Lasiosphaeris hirsuta TaxID=260670 RepID=A0AA40BB22_9PEZI|nr:hypothetical protein B0H67DRAFT_639418 [Lasiosphaeris hirsuta]